MSEPRARELLDAPEVAPLRRPLAARGLPRRSFDVVVVGAGIAGLAFALRLPPRWRVALLTKGTLGESNTRYAQGGLAAAVGADDSPALHEADTLAAGAGLCDVAAVLRLVEGAPAAVEWLLGLGTRFDRADDSGALLLGREAAHGRRRVLHAGGDATGAEIERALVARVREDPGITIYERAFALDIAVHDGRCAGLVVQLAPGEGPALIAAPVVVLAAGGAGQLWATTSNPTGATADGLAMAIRAGAAIADVEFVQFHPTVLAQPGAPAFLVSEAVRGEGAYLRGANGERFMLAAHPLAELAPRDVVARAIQRQMAAEGSDHVALDLRHLDAAEMRLRFPTIARELAARGLDLARDPIPVAPAAHYFMGGVVADTAGRTSLPGLLAIGEAACTGVHGANRLASNSLLEGLVFGLAAADALAREGLPSPPVVPAPDGTDGRAPYPAPTKLAAPADERVALQRTMSRHVAVVRDAGGLDKAAREIARLATRLTSTPLGDRAAWELRNMTLAAAASVTAAARRTESRGAHYRADFSERDPVLDGQHDVYDARGGWRSGALTAVLDETADIAARGAARE